MIGGFHQPSRSWDHDHPEQSQNLSETLVGRVHVQWLLIVGLECVDFLRETQKM
jgi:hypothetical protein